MMNIKCKKCGYTEETNKDFWVKVIGSTIPIVGFWGWTAFIFAGTGFALPIVTAMIIGGSGMLVYKDKIVKWISDKYECPECDAKSWDLVEN